MFCKLPELSSRMMSSSSIDFRLILGDMNVYVKIWMKGYSFERHSLKTLKQVNCSKLNDNCFRFAPCEVHWAVKSSPARNTRVQNIQRSCIDHFNRNDKPNYSPKRIHPRSVGYPVIWTRILIHPMCVHSKLAGSPPDKYLALITFNNFK